MPAAAQVPVCILEPMSGHLVDPKSSKFLSQKVLTTATFRIGFYCLEKKFSSIFMISRIYTNHYGGDGVLAKTILSSKIPNKCTKTKHSNDCSKNVFLKCRFSSGNIRYKKRTIIFWSARFIKIENVITE